MIDIVQLVALQSAAVARWHLEPMTNDGEGFDRLVLANHQVNFRLWHEEDQARDPAASDSTIAQVKRRIDGLNQQRSDSIEQLDSAVADVLAGERAAVDRALPMNTETPGSAIDRLSILALRIFHLDEQSQRAQRDESSRQRVRHSLQIAAQQRHDLAESLQQLLHDLRAGRKRHQAFRQLKMYNDPELNPAIYQHHHRQAKPS